MTTATPVRNRFIDTTPVTGYPEATHVYGAPGISACTVLTR